MDLRKLKQNGTEISENAKNDLLDHLKKSGEGKKECGDVSLEKKFDRESIKNFIKLSRKISQ